MFLPLVALFMLGACVSQESYDRLKASNKPMSQEVQTLTSQADIALDTTEDGKHKNRRIEIVLLPILK